MTAVTTRVSKNIRGNWEAETQLPFAPAADGKERRLTIRTSKVSSGRLHTSATVSVHEGNWTTHEMFSDFNQTIESTADRCTEKNVAVQHSRALAKSADITEAATAFYKQKEQVAA